MEDVVVLVVVAEEAGVVLDRMIPLRAIAVGCVAIWPATVPNLYSHREVALPALPVEVRLNPGDQAQKEAEGSTFGLAG